MPLTRKYIVSKLESIFKRLMIKFLNILINKIYKIVQQTFDFVIFSQFLYQKKFSLEKYTFKYGFLRIYPDKYTYFRYLSKLGDHLNLKEEIKNSRNIISIGTCFAEQITQYLDYLHNVEEKTITNSLGFAADWGRVTSIEHLFRLSTLYLDEDISKFCKVKSLKNIDNRSKKKLINSFKNHSPNFDSSKNKIIIDTSREHLILHSSKSGFNKSINSHIKCAQKVLNQCDTIFITIGQTGYFLDMNNNFYAKKPPSTFVQMESIQFIEENFSSFSQLINKLEICIGNLRKLSSNPKLFISLSPIPAFAYFGNNKKSVLEYHWYSKSILYQVINEVIRNDATINYIPTFEAVMSSNLTSISDDLRHLKPWFRSRIFDNLLN